MFQTKFLIRRIVPTLTAAAASAVVFGIAGTAANAQSSQADFSQTDNTSFNFVNHGAASSFSVSGAAFNFNFNGTTYHALLSISSNVSGSATSDAVSGDSGSGTVTENLSNLNMEFINADSTSSVHNLLSLHGGTGSLYGLLDDPTDSHSNVSVAGLLALNGTWSSNIITIDSSYPNSVTMGGITPNSDVSLQNNGHLSSFSTSQGGVTGGFQGRPVPEAGTLFSLGGMVLSSGAVAGRNGLRRRRAARQTPSAT